jgi:membrane-bound ClpP family serine protease
MEFLQNPNVVYLLLAGGLIFAVLALVAPGTGVLEIGAVLLHQSALQNVEVAQAARPFRW